MIERISFDVLDIVAGDDRAVILGSLESKLKRTNKIIKTDFAIVSPSPMVKLFAFRCWKTVWLSPRRPTLTDPRATKGFLFSSAKTKLVSWNELVSLGTEFSI